MEIEILTFECDQLTFGVRAQCVSEVLRAVSLSHLPQSPDVVMGVVNLRGCVLPVLNTKRLLGLQESEIRHTDHLVVVDAEQVLFALHVDRAIGLTKVRSDEHYDHSASEQSSRFIDLIAKTKQGIVQVLDPARILSDAEIKDLLRIVSSTTATEPPSS